MEELFANSNSSKLTVAELRVIPGFENIPEEQAHQIINTLSVFCEICYSVYVSEKVVHITHNEAEHFLRAA